MTDRWRVGANLATLGNGLLGVGAVLYTVAGNKLWAMLLITLAIGLDGLDGLLSRRSGSAPGAFGRIADSAADAVSFGVAPAVLVAVHTSEVGLWAPYATLTLLAALVYLGAAVARLAYFTARAHALPHFLGIPSPQAALAVIVTGLFLDTPALARVDPAVTVAVVLAIAVLMLVPVPYPKIRRGSPLRWPMATTAAFGALALVPLQFRLGRGSPLYDLASAGAWGLLVGVAAYYLVGPFTLGRRKEG